MLEPENQVCFLINFIDTKQQFISDFFIGIHLLDQCYQERYTVKLFAYFIIQLSPM
jgi:hypothetical protein